MPRYSDMPRYILHKEGAYQVYSTIVDAPLYDHALTLDELITYLRDPLYAGAIAMAHATGCSAHGMTLEQCIAGNRAGPNETEVPYDEFIRRWLTLPNKEQDK